MRRARLESSITDNLIHIEGYDIIRKDRSRNGGGVCIYLRSSINYNVRFDLIPSELEAVCIEIAKQFPDHLMHHRNSLIIWKS